MAAKEPTVPAAAGRGRAADGEGEEAMSEKCPDCGRPFATTAHEQAYPAWCNGGGSYGCLRSKLSASEAEVARLTSALEESGKNVNRLTVQLDVLQEENARLLETDMDLRVTNRQLLAEADGLRRENARLRQEVDDMFYLDAAACRHGTRLDIPSKIPGFDPGDADHIHFVMVPIGPAARRAAVEYLAREGKARKP